MLAAAAVLTAQTPNISLCQGIAAQIRQNAASSLGDPIEPLFKGDHPYIETPSNPDIRVLWDNAQFTQLFRQKFHPSDAMSNALDGFGAANPPVPGGEEENVRTMEALAAKMQRNRYGNSPIPFPAFGHENELDAFQSTLGLIDNCPVVLYGNVYLVAIGRGVIGWRDSPDFSGLVLYTLSDGKLQPVGSAIVQQSRGALKSSNATPWTLRH